MTRQAVILAALTASAGGAFAQTATFSVADFAIAAGDVFDTGLDLSGIDFSNPYISFRVVADYAADDPTGAGAFDSDYSVAFGDPSITTLFTADVAALNATGSAGPTPSLTFAAFFDDDGSGGFSGLPAVDIVVFDNEGFGSSTFSNVTVEWFTAADVAPGLDTFIGGGSTASPSAPSSFTDLGAVAVEGDAVTIDTIASDLTGFDTTLAIYSADGTLLAFDDDGSGIGLTSLISFGPGDGDLIIGADGTPQFEGGVFLAEGDYFIGVGEFDTIFDADFAFDTAIGFPGPGGAFAGEINGVTFNGTLGPGPDASFFRFTVTPTPATAGLFGLAGLAAVRRRR